MDELGMVGVVGVTNNWGRSTNLSWNLPGHGMALGHRLRMTHLLRNLPGDSVTSFARNRNTNGNRHTVWSHHLSWSTNWHLVAFSLRHLMAERLSMGDSNRTCSHKVTVGWAHQLGVSISISLPLAESMASVTSMSMMSNSRNCMAVSVMSSSNSRSSMDSSRDWVSMMSSNHSNGLTNH